MPRDEEADPAEPFPILGDRFSRALVLATELHARQARKGSRVPDMCHLLAVTATMVLEGGADEDTACAALLHDAVDDQGGKLTAEPIEREFGTCVADIVGGCSETDVTPKPPWMDRKRRYLWHLEHDAHPDVLLVALADKVHNLHAMLADRRTSGPEVWARFNAPMEDQLRYYGSLVDVFRRRLPCRRSEELAELFAHLVRLEGSPSVGRLATLDPGTPVAVASHLAGDRQLSSASAILRSWTVTHTRDG